MGDIVCPRQNPPCANTAEGDHKSHHQVFLSLFFKMYRGLKYCYSPFQSADVVVMLSKNETCLICLMGDPSGVEISRGVNFVSPDQINNVIRPYRDTATNIEHD